MINKELLKQLVERQNHIKILKQSLMEHQRVFDLQIEGVINQKKDIEADVDLIKNTIKKAALEEYQETSEKKLLGGIGIRVTEDLIFNRSEALDWAKKHELCLQLDSKAFKKFAKIQPLKFVEKKEKVMVTFPKQIIV